MWGWITRAATFLWAHREEAAIAVEVIRGLRGRRQKNHIPGESVKDYYAREGKSALVNVALSAVGPEDKIVVDDDSAGVFPVQD